MSIDLHADWKPPALIEAPRNRENPPHIVRDTDGDEAYATARGRQPIGKAFDDVETRLAEMDRYGVSTAVLSLQSAFTWIERLPVAESLPVARLRNDGPPFAPQFAIFWVSFTTRDCSRIIPLSSLRSCSSARIRRSSADCAAAGNAVPRTIAKANAANAARAV